ncbi:hypothetical protein S245_013200, partial [Arachis hypogaea]
HRSELQCPTSFARVFPSWQQLYRSALVLHRSPIAQAHLPPLACLSASNVQGSLTVAVVDDLR